MQQAVEDVASNTGAPLTRAVNFREYRSGENLLSVRQGVEAESAIQTAIELIDIAASLCKTISTFNGDEHHYRWMEISQMAWAAQHEAETASALLSACESFRRADQ